MTVPASHRPIPTTTDAAELLGPYVTNTDRPVFALRNLPEEVVAVLFAYYSRSPGELRQTLLHLLLEGEVDVQPPLQLATYRPDGLAAARQKAQTFHEKYVLGYGHASVAEHAIAHIAIENVSILLTKVIEDTRLASFTEKSTRYVLFNRDHFYRDPRLLASQHAALYEDTCSHLLETYASLADPVREAIQQAYPRPPEQTEAAYTTAVHGKVCDTLRYLLPAATLTNLGLTANARVLDHLITKLLSHPLAEAQTIGTAVRDEAHQIIPTLLKHAAYNPYRAETPPAISALSARHLGKYLPAYNSAVTLVHWPVDADERLLAAILYEHSQLSFTRITAEIRRLSPEDRAEILAEYLRRRGPHDQPLRALEHLTYTFDILIDFGAFRDIQRHRMCTQTPQALTAIYGYTTPPELTRFKRTASYHARMAEAERAYETLVRDFPHEAQYVLPLAFRKRVLFTWNLRELHHLIQLRTSRQGHASYRRIAQEVFYTLQRVHPLLAEYIRADLNDYAFAR